MKSRSGLLLINKPKGITSFQAVSILKKNLQEKRVGHAGTLDKFAEGLLLVLFGKMTRLVSFFTDFDKIYEAEFKFGESTDTLDPEGILIDQKPVPSLQAIKKGLKEFIGFIDQVPPEYSAVHVNGKRAYALARKGQEVMLRPRKINVFSIEILSWTAPFLKLKIHCSKGTYVRSLARDLGKKCGSAAFVTALNRIQSGPYRIDDAVPPDYPEIQTKILQDLDLFSVLPGFTPVILKDEHVGDITQGKKIQAGMFFTPPENNGKYAVFQKESFLALIEKDGDKYSYCFVNSSNE